MRRLLVIAVVSCVVVSGCSQPKQARETAVPAAVVESPTLMIPATMVAPTIPTTLAVTTTKVPVESAESRVLAGFGRYLVARAEGDNSGAVGSAAFRLREARSSSILVAKLVRVNGDHATVEACAETEERLLVLGRSGGVWSVEHVLAPSTAGWCL
jgi:hypothetical protein